MRLVNIFFVIFFLLFHPAIFAETKILPGAEQTALYFPLLKNKRVALFVNQSSRVGNEHLIDLLQKKGIRIVKIFVPEHGLRGDHEGTIKNAIDEKSGIPIVSLYGKKFKPNADDLADVDVMVFDIQDVGVRFYTYISSLQRYMEAAIDNKKPLIILDRPNPNGFYVDGPVLEAKHRSFTGMQPIPIVYGMTMGEYAKMLAGEEWLNVKPKNKSKELQLTVIPCANYTHHSLYVPPVKPSPNLPNAKSIYLYPSIGIMEATAMSVGRGTDKPFEVFGHPKIKSAFYFIPTPKKGAEQPLFRGKKCYGWKIDAKTLPHLQLQYLITAYRHYPDKKHFFRGFASSAGTDELQKQIIAGMSEKQIRASWQPKLNEFKKIRERYLIYS